MTGTGAGAKTLARAAGKVSLISIDGPQSRKQRDAASTAEASRFVVASSSSRKWDSVLFCPAVGCWSFLPTVGSMV